MTEATMKPKPAKAATVIPMFEMPKFGEMPSFELPKMEIPAAFREFAEKGVAQTKDAYEKIKSVAEQNIANSFEFAQKLVRAKDIQEVMALQQEYLQSQMKAMSAQAKDLGSSATKAAMDAAKPKT